MLRHTLHFAFLVHRDANMLIYVGSLKNNFKFKDDKEKKLFLQINIIIKLLIL